MPLRPYFLPLSQLLFYSMLVPLMFTIWLPVAVKAIYFLIPTQKESKKNFFPRQDSSFCLHND